MPYHGLESLYVGELKRLKARDLGGYADRAIDIAAGLGANVTTYGFDAALGIPHDSIDLTTDPDKKAIVYAKILDLLGEPPLQ